MKLSKMSSDHAASLRTLAQAFGSAAKDAEQKGDEKVSECYYLFRNTLIGLASTWEFEAALEAVLGRHVRETIAPRSTSTDAVAETLCRVLPDDEMVQALRSHAAAHPDQRVGALIAEAATRIADFADALRAAPSNQAAGEPRALFMQLVHEELERAYAKHGRDPWGRHEFYAILLEEVDELWDAIKANRPDADVHAEMVQVAAMCFRFWETGDRYAVQKEPEAHPLECLRQHLSVGEDEEGGLWGLWCGGGEMTPALYAREPQTEEEERKRDEGDPNWGPDVDGMLAEYAASLSEKAAP